MDIGDYAQVEEARFLNRALSSQQQHQKEEPDEDAMGRYCLDCGEMIPVARLKAEPDAVCCTPCKSIREKKESIRVGHR